MKLAKGRTVVLMAGILLAVSACSVRRHPVDTPLITNSQQPDKELFDRATNFLEHGRFTEARLVLQTLINAYPESEYLAKAKLMIADSWYRSGSTSDLVQAEAEYRDFITFFPTMPEAAEAQMRVAMIHYLDMDKPDRDAEQARRAEQEFQRLLLTYPNSPFAPMAEQRLREVQEVLAEGIFDVADYYYLNKADFAAQPRLKELVDRYPSYSKADEALYILAKSMERNSREKSTEEVVDYYSRIIRDYPLSPHVEEAKQRLQALGVAVPQADPVAVARMTYEEAHAGQLSLWDRMMTGLQHRPSVVAAQGQVGPPTMTAQGPAQVSVQPVAQTNARIPAAAVAPSSGASTIMMEQVPDSSSGSGR